MTNVIVYEQDFGNGPEVIVILPVDTTRSMDYFVQKSVPANTDYWIMDNSILPDNPLFRSAWQLDSAGNVSYNLDKAKLTWVNFWRAARTPLLKSLDVQVMRAMEDGNTDLQKQFVAQKNQLRDVTTTDLLSVTSIDELQAVWPDCLGSQPDKLKPQAYKQYLRK